MQVSVECVDGDVPNPEAAEIRWNEVPVYFAPSARGVDVEVVA